MTLGTAIRYLKQGNWQRAHEIVQTDESSLGCWAHGIVHMMEGDVANARYWYRRAHRAFPGEGQANDELVALSLAWKDERESSQEGRS